MFAAIISFAFVCGLIRSIEADLKWLFRERDMTIKQNKAGRRYRSPKLRVRPGQVRRDQLITDLKTVEIINRLRTALRNHEPRR